MKMVLLIFAALAVPLALGYLGVLPGMLVLVAEIAILLAVAWQFDRGRGAGSRAPFLDANRADLASPMADHTMYPPREAIERPTDRPGPD
jgi:hypothetical protein